MSARLPSRGGNGGVGSVGERTMRIDRGGSKAGMGPAPTVSLPGVPPAHRQGATAFVPPLVGATPVVALVAPRSGNGDTGGHRLA